MTRELDRQPVALGAEQDQVAQTKPRSRKVANAKRSAFQAKLNRIFFWILLLIAALVYAMFNL